MRLLFFILFLSNCFGIFQNRTVGYKEFSNVNQTKLVAILDEQNIEMPRLFFESEPIVLKTFKKNLKHAILVSFLNSGKFSNVFWKEDYKQISDKEIIVVEINFKAENNMRIGSYKYYPNSSIFYIPKNIPEAADERIFWPTFFPGFWPATGYFPLLAKSGTVKAQIQCKFITKGARKEKISIQKSQNYHLLFYGIYRNAEVEEKLILTIERLLEENSLVFADLELEDQ